MRAATIQLDCFISRHDGILAITVLFYRTLAASGG